MIAGSVYKMSKDIKSDVVRSPRTWNSVSIFAHPVPSSQSRFKLSILIRFSQKCRSSLKIIFITKMFSAIIQNLIGLLWSGPGY